ncbi:hypothetical protein KIPB_011587, partial [Kipferlia bialata]
SSYDSGNQFDFDSDLLSLNGYQKYMECATESSNSATLSWWENLVDRKHFWESEDEWKSDLLRRHLDPSGKYWTDDYPLTGALLSTHQGSISESVFKQYLPVRKAAWAEDNTWALSGMGLVDADTYYPAMDEMIFDKSFPKLEAHPSGSDRPPQYSSYGIHLLSWLVALDLADSKGDVCNIMYKESSDLKASITDALI